MSVSHAFPNLRPHDYKLTSPATPEYNCIAWAAGEDDRWWWPDPDGQCYWPDDVPREETLEAFIAAYRALGYEPCKQWHSEKGYEKVAIFADANGTPTHAARQQPNGVWTSKMGRQEDMDHTLLSIAGGTYGTVRRVLRRQLPSNKK